MLKSLLALLQNFAVQALGLSEASYPVHAKPDGAKYRAYTTEFDETIDGATFLRRAMDCKGPNTLSINRYVNVDYAAFAKLAKSIRTNCMTLSGQLQLLPSTNRDDMIVTLLFDHSGSLRGLHALVVTELAEALADALTSAGIATDILGFTTVRWKGGRAREKWLSDGRPRFPGRLNDLLHIIHLDGSNGPSRGPHQFPAMSHEHMLKENIDGEALAWASRRLLDNERNRKILIVFSDGAPVDDSTLYDNWPTILSDHAAEVAAGIAKSGKVVLGAVGIEHAVDRYYPNNTTAESLSALATVAPNFVERLVSGACK